jgi:membrane fusion protein, heavy metal efflux system
LKRLLKVSAGRLLTRAVHAKEPRPLGSGMLMAGFLALVMVTTGCQKTSANEETPAPAVKAAQATQVELEQNMMANVHIEQVREQSLPKLLTGTGKVQFNEDRTTRVLAPLPGQVLDLAVRVGDPVQKDQVLFSIKSREVAALVTDYLESQRDQDLAEKTFNMTKDLFEHQAASRISFQQAEGDLAKARTHVARAEEALVVLGLNPKEAQKNLRTVIPVRAPAAGVVIERNLASNQFVQADSTPLLTVADLSTVWVLVDVFERDIHLVHPGQKAKVVAVAYPDRRFSASVERISDKVDPDSRTLKVRLLVSNPNLLLKPEMFISASLDLGQGTKGITVPAKALFTEGDKNYLFVATGERTFERRLVSAAPDGEGRLRVASGLRDGDRVVTDGTLLVRARQVQGQD